MSREERSGTRDLVYSTWHRSKSLARFIDDVAAERMSMIDLDGCMFVEYMEEGRVPLMLIELARDVGQSYKTARVTRNLALMAGIEAYTVLYTVSGEPNPYDRRQRDIDKFRMQRIAPYYSEFFEFTPQRYAKVLLELRQRAERNALKRINRER